MDKQLFHPSNVVAAIIDVDACKEADIAVMVDGTVEDYPQKDVHVDIITDEVGEVGKDGL